MIETVKRRILAVILTLVVLMGTVCSAAGFEEFGDLGIYGEEDRFPVFEDGTDSSVENPDDSSGGWEEFPGDETLPPQWQEETIPEETLPEEACPVETLPLDEMEEKENESTLPTEQETEPAEMELQPTETVEADEVALTELYKDCMTIEELTNLDMETAGAATEYLPENPVLFSLSAERPEMWSFDAYYVNQEDSYSVMKTRDFSLKYQFEFHTDTDLEVEAVSLRFPLALLQDRYGKELTPSDIGVPFGTPENFIPISTSPFNYYTEGADLVFFNYRKILSGTNAAVQILYKNIKILDIPDQMQWQLLPQALVTVGENTETLQTQSLTGMVDTKAELAFVKKAAEKEAGKNYTPVFIPWNSF